MGSTSRGEAGADRTHGGRSTWFVAELGPAGIIVLEARSHLTSVGSTGGAPRGSVADLGFARCTPTGRSRRRCSCSDMGIALARPCTVVELGLAATPIRAASGSCSTARHPNGCGSTRTRSVMGRTGCPGAVVGRARPGGRSTRRALETRPTDSAFMEPAASCMGPAQARGLGAIGPGIRRLGSASPYGGSAAADCRPLMGGARCTSPG